jgi:4-diphosphocytidyl-2-C-methyl-D-erythritol kinase
MTFADVGDTLRIDDSAESEVVIEGLFASGLPTGPDNLVVRARQAALAVASHDSAAFRLRLTKNLPLAAGIGGGSADAAAAFRLLAARLNVEMSAFLDAAASLGSDVPACLASRPILATGRGDVLEPSPAFPSLHAVLVNPGVAAPTADAYRAYDAAPSPEGANRPWPTAALRSPRETAAFLSACRNDLEAPVASQLRPVADALAVLRRQPETLLARMSGSGATCFAIVEDTIAADRLLSRISEGNPDWWVRRTILAGAP